jgi:hypothetical protein
MEIALAHTTDGEQGRGQIGQGPGGTGQGQAQSLRGSAIWASAAGYYPADIAEERAIKHVFGSDSASRVISPKKYLGEPGGAGGIFNAALALTAWQNRDASIVVSVPSNGSRKDIGSRRLPAGKVYTPNPNESSGNALGQGQSLRTEMALINSCSLGGTHFSIVLASMDNKEEQKA